MRDEIAPLVAVLRETGLVNGAAIAAAAEGPNRLKIKAMVVEAIRRDISMSLLEAYHEMEECDDAAELAEQTYKLILKG